MDSFFVRNRLSDYIDGTLSADDARAVAEALQRDGALRAEFEGLRRTVELTRRHGPLRAPAALADRVRAELEASPGGVAAPPPRWSRTLRLEAMALVAAAAIVVVVIHDTPLAQRGGEPSAGAHAVSTIQAVGAKDAPGEPSAPGAAQRAAGPDAAGAGSTEVGAATPANSGGPVGSGNASAGPGEAGPWPVERATDAELGAEPLVPTITKAKRPAPAATAEPYQAEWEQAESQGVAAQAPAAMGTEPSDAASGTASSAPGERAIAVQSGGWFLWSTDDSMALYKLDDLASRVDGRVRNVAIQPMTMDLPRVTAQLWVPRTRLPEAEAALQALGAAAQNAEAEVTFQGSEVILWVSVRYGAATKP